MLNNRTEYFNIVKLTINAIAPAKVSKVVVDEDQKHIDIWVPEDQLSIAIGRRGQNVKLASMLTNWKLDVLNAEEQEKNRAEDIKLKTEQFISALDVDDLVAHMLIAEGFNSLEELTLVPMEEIASIEGFDENLATEIQNRAKSYVEKQREETAKLLKEKGMEEDLINFTGIKPEYKVILCDNNIKTLDDLADLDMDELKTLLPMIKSSKEIETIIIKAREHWFKENEMNKSSHFV